MSSAMRAVPLIVLCSLIIAVPSAWANWVPDGVAICTATGGQYSQQITSDGAGGAIITWRDNRNGNYDIYAQRLNASGAVRWAANGVALCTATVSQNCVPTIVSDGAGGAIVTWEDLRNGNADNADIYAQRVNASGAVQWTVNGVVLCTATGDQEWARASSDGAGGAIVTWEDNRKVSNWDIYVQRVNSSGAVQWTANGVALCTATGDQFWPQITSDGAGGAIVTWNDWPSGGYSDIYAQRVNASGAVQWTANGVALCTAMWDQDDPAIVSDGAGGAIVTWRDNRSNYLINADIYAQRVNASGAVQWTTDGVAICTATANSATLPQITSDGAGGAIVTWEDMRSGSTHHVNIYVQRANASGAVQWTVNGVALCSAAWDQESPAIVSDGAGGAIVTWQDDRSGSVDPYIYHIYAQRVKVSGAVQWMVNGVALCAATGNQYTPTIASGGAGGGIVTWHDYRNGNYDIYAQIADFPLATDAAALPIELHQNYPNPFNPATTVTYSVPEKCNVTFKIYDVSGKCIACLVDRQQEKGSHSVEWNGKDETGNSLASGIYLYRLTAGNQTISKKMVLLR